jgi:hypothetical protein
MNGAARIAVIALIGKLPFDVKRLLKISPHNIKIPPKSADAGIRTK